MLRPKYAKIRPNEFCQKHNFSEKKQNQGDSSAVWTYPKSDLASFSVPSKEGNPSLIFGSTADYKLFPFEFVCLQLANVEQLGPKKPSSCTPQVGTTSLIPGYTGRYKTFRHHPMCRPFPSHSEAVPHGHSPGPASSDLVLIKYRR